MRKDAVPGLRRPAAARRTGSAGGSGAAVAGAPGASAEALAPEDQALFEDLRAWRAKVAKERSVPAYVVFHDSTLRALATTRPGTRGELADVPGIGQAKLDAYAEAVLGVIGGTSPTTEAGEALPPAP
jgi:ATP-dependent DNA helicase RecQ